MWPDIINKSRMAVFLLVMIISGCLGFNNPPYGTSMETVLEDKVKEIYPGETDRDAVLRIMGEPIISSRYWKIDVFRSTEKQYAGVVVLVPLPIPVWSNDLIHRDTIVHYNSDDIVDHFDSKAYLKSDPWSVTLEIGKFQVRNDSDNKMFILLESEEMKEYLDYVSKKEECVIILGCKFRL